MGTYWYCCSGVLVYTYSSTVSAIETLIVVACHVLFFTTVWISENELRESIKIIIMMLISAHVLVLYSCFDMLLTAVINTAAVVVCVPHARLHTIFSGGLVLFFVFWDVSIRNSIRSNKQIAMQYVPGIIRIWCIIRTWYHKVLYIRPRVKKSRRRYIS